MGAFLYATHSFAQDEAGGDGKEIEQQRENESQKSEKEITDQMEKLIKAYEQANKNASRQTSTSAASRQTATAQADQTATEQSLIDSDGDTVPDQLDQHPGVDDYSYFTDSDNDGIIDALDKHPGENDAIYAVTDANENGIVDATETLVQKN